MTITSTLKRNLAAFALTAAVLGAGTAASFAEPGEGSAPTPGAKEAHHRGKGGMHGAVHGDLVVPNPEGGFHTVQLDRGTLEAKDGNRLTVKRPDGPTVTVTLNDRTRYRGADGPDGLETGRPVMVVSKDGTALTVGQPPERGERRRGRGPAPAGPRR